MSLPFIYSVIRSQLPLEIALPLTIGTVFSQEWKRKSCSPSHDSTFERIALSTTHTHTHTDIAKTHDLSQKAQFDRGVWHKNSTNRVFCMYLIERNQNDVISHMNSFCSSVAHKNCSSMTRRKCSAREKKPSTQSTKFSTKKKPSPHTHKRPSFLRKKN
jgi:hypothetical protein